MLFAILQLSSAQLADISSSSKIRHAIQTMTVSVFVCQSPFSSPHLPDPIIPLVLYVSREPGPAFVGQPILPCLYVLLAVYCWLCSGILFCPWYSLQVCNHRFHNECLQRWGDLKCPVCRYCAQASSTTSHCSVCDTSQVKSLLSPSLAGRNALCIGFAL